MQASDVIVRSCSTTVTSWPATPFSTFGVTAMSDPSHGPSGSASTGAVVVAAAVAVTDGVAPSKG